MVSKNIIAAQIVRSITASVSFSASSFLCYTIWRSPNRLSSPYSRIIFGLSIADILQSSGILLGQVLSPVDTPDAIFSRGNIASCEAIGYILIVGSLAIVWYTLFLTYYFLRRVKYKKKPQDFAQQEEYYIAMFIWVYPLLIAAFALKMKDINATQYGSTCYISPKPWECVIDEDIECTRGENARLLVSIAGMTILFAFVCLVAVLITFTCYIYNAEKHLQGNTLTKKATFQSVLYILAFMVVYSGPMILVVSRFSGKENSTVSFWIMSIFYPIGGFLNMLIYTRPKVEALKKLEPQIPVIICFIGIILAGGEVPSLADLNRSNPGSVTQSRLAQISNRLGWPTKSANLDQALDDYMRGLYENENQEKDDELAPERGNPQDQSSFTENENASTKKVKFSDEFVSDDLSISGIDNKSSIYHT